jgi:hypothetical protein
MPTLGAEHSWRVTPAAVSTLALALALLAIAGSAGELAARTSFARSHLRMPSVTGWLRSLDVQLDRLDELTRDGRPIDCVFVGSSLVLTGLDPDEFSEQLQARTGKAVRCFNLGVTGATARDTAILARILVERLRPWLVIYGASTRDISPSTNGPGLAATPWARYWQGDATGEGWLIEHSRAYRYYLAYRNSIVSGAAEMEGLGAVRSNGYLPTSGTLMEQSEQVAIGERMLLAQFSDRELSQDQLRGFDDLLSLQAGGTHVAIIEMPAHPRHWPILRTTAGYARFLERMRDTAAARAVPFWPTMSLGLVSEDGWADSVHLNQAGAGVLTRWLADQVADAIKSGQLPAPPSAGS